MSSSDKHFTFYMNENQKLRFDDVAAKLTKYAGVMNLYNKDGSVNRSAVINYLIFNADAFFRDKIRK